MTIKQMKENYELLMKLPIVPKSLNLAGIYISTMFENFDFTTMPESEHNEALKLIGLALERYRKIREH